MQGQGPLVWWVGGRRCQERDDMGASELGSPEGDDEETRRTRGDTPARPEQPSRPETRDAGSDATERTSAETLTREEYADDMRGQGDPIPSGDGDGDGDGGPDRAEPDERDSDDTAAEDDRAEPRDRETYADDMRADAPDAFFFQAEDGIRDYKVTGVQTCALPISVAHMILLRFCSSINQSCGLN